MNQAARHKTATRIKRIGESMLERSGLSTPAPAKQNQRSSLDVLQRLLEVRARENESILVVQIAPGMHAAPPAQMSRVELLDECRKDASLTTAGFNAAATEWAAHHSETKHLELRHMEPRLSRAGSPGSAEGERSARSRSRESSRDSSPQRRSHSAAGERGAGTCADAAGPRQAVHQPLEARDIRCMLSVSEPTLLVRRGAFLISFSELRAIVTAARAFLLLPHGDPASIRQLQARLAEEAQGPEAAALPFELQVLEAVLVTTINEHLVELEHSWHESRDAIAGLRASRDVTPALLNSVFVLKGRASHQLAQVSGMEEALERVQNDDLLMASMTLTALQTRRRRRGAAAAPRRGAPAAHVEILLDTYALELHAMATRLSLILRQIDATEDLVNLRLENIQKNTFIANTFFHLVQALLGVPAVVASFFGMNLWSGAKFRLTGPGTPGVPAAPADYPAVAERFDNDPSLGVSWVFLYASAGVVLLTSALFACILAYVRLQGLVEFRP